MTPGARVSAAIEVLDQILMGKGAEQALLTWSRNSRFAGSKDRAAVRDHVFDALRRKRSAAAIGGGENGRAIMIGLLSLQGDDLASLFSGQGHAPKQLTDIEIKNLTTPREQSRGEKLDVPDWLLPEIDRSLGANASAVCTALKYRAPVTLRANIAKISADQLQSQLAAEGITDVACRDAVAKFRAEFDRLDEVLAEQTYILGNDLSLLDIAWYVYAFRLNLGGYPLNELHPNVAAWFHRLGARPEFSREVAFPETLAQIHAAARAKQIETGTAMREVVGL